MTTGLRVEKQFGGAILKFKCDVFYALNGTDTLICDGTNWSDRAPICESKNIVKHQQLYLCQLYTVLNLSLN